MSGSVEGEISGKRERRLTIPGWMYAAISLVLVVSMGMMVYDYYLGRRLTTMYHPVTDALIEIKLEWTKGYLKTAEVLRGTAQYKADIVDEHFAYADWYAKAMLEGGQNSLGTFVPINNFFLREKLSDLRIKLQQFRGKVAELLRAGPTGGRANAEVLHQSFAGFVADADAIETILQSSVRTAFEQFRVVQNVLLVFFFLLLGGILTIFRFYEHRRVLDFQVIRQANARFQEEINERKRVEADLSLSGAELERNNKELLEARFEVEKRNWLQTGETELHDVMNGAQEIETLGNHIITFLAEYLNAVVGSFYVAVSDHDLKLVGGYAYQETIARPEHLGSGQGLVGQAVATGRKIVLREVPADYLKISSSLGVTEPRSIVVLPFFFEDKVKGVLELGALHEFNDFHLGLLDEVSHNIGMAVNLCQAREHMAKLLEQTRIQAAELQAQQEELRVTNEELQEQTDILKESEEALQTQQEELQVANEELEERTRTLEKQKDAIHRQNEALEKAKIDIQQKAMDLEMASRYKSEFLANMSHELRTPLNSMIILSHLLADQGKNDNLTKKQLEYAATIHSSGQDLLHLINEILDLSKVEAGKLTFTMAPMVLADVAGSCEGLFREVAAGKGLNFAVELAADLPAQIETDGRRLLQIINNFLSNAFKFTEKGGVTLRIYCPKAEEIVAAAPAGQDSTKYIAIAVSDTGIGVPLDKHQAIFEAFQQADGTTSRKYGGTGLGLSISRELAWVLGGEIRMTSQEGRGSTFTLYVPERPLCSTPSVPKPAAVATKPPTLPLPAMQLRPQPDDEVRDDRKHIRPSDKSLLIIEDDVLFSQVVVDLGKEAGFQCLVAEDGETGLHFADYYKPSAIILDIGLPGIDGWQVMERLKSNPATRHIPVHFISGHDNPMEALKMGAIGFITKPIDAKALQDVFHNLEQVLSRRAKRLLIVEDNEVLRHGLVELIGNGDVVTIDVGSGTEALEQLVREPFDCMILDLGLHDMTGFELLARMRERSLANLPIIIYTGKALTRDEEENLQQYADSIIVKGVKSPERLLAETTLFLHRVEANLPEEKQQMLRMVHNREAMLVDKKIMVVDDDMRNVYALTGLLEGKGMQVVVARDGREGLSKLKENPDIALILMDIMMPEMDGYATMREIRKQREFAKLPIIALTAKAMRGDRTKCIEAGANDYLPKPIDSEKLLSLLRVWLYQ